MTVWVVEQGEYSAYHVVGVFSTQANAQMVADAINAVASAYERATVAEWPLDPAVEQMRQGYRPWRVLMQRDGTVERCDTSEISGYQMAGEATVWRRSSAPFYRGTGLPDVMNATVWAADETHAVKVANERRAQLIASGQWDAKGEA